MQNVPYHHYPEVMVAVRIARILAEADLVHGVADHVGEMSAIDWAAEFVKTHGNVFEPSNFGRAQYTEDLKAFVYQKARFDGWVPREVRDTQSEEAADIRFKEKLSAAKEINKLPAGLPRSQSHYALIDSVVEELQRRALFALQNGRPLKAFQISFESDGRFEKILMNGIRIATCSAGERDPKQWIAALQSNLGIQVKPANPHQVLVEINGKEIVCTGENVRVQVFNERLHMNEGGAHSMLFNFTEEGVINDLCNAKGDVVGTCSSMYDEAAEEIVGEREDEQQIKEVSCGS